MKNLNEKELINLCLQEIEEKLHWGNSGNWHSDVFIELSEIIQKKTQILLSPTTLKRVWGKVKYNNSPSISTLNTLSQFNGYKNWRDYKNDKQLSDSKKTTSKPKVNMPLVFGLAAFFALLFISLYSTISPDKEESSYFDLKDIKFSSRPVTTGLPNSVVFDLDIKDIESDSIFIQQYWDKNKTIKLSNNQKQATGIYYFPGYFRAKLVVDGTIIKEHDLFIKSNGWSGSIDYNPIPKYLNPSDFVNDGLKLGNNLIDEIKSSEKPLYSTFHFINDMGNVSGDNFTLETSIKNTYREKWAVCQNSSIYVIGSKGALIIPFSILGCSASLNIMLNDVFLNGKKQDLSTLSMDFSEFQEIKISNTEKHVKIHSGEKEIFSANYYKTLGKLVGFRYKFLGAGQVDYIKVQDDQGNIILDNFNQ